MSRHISRDELLARADGEIEERSPHLEGCTRCRRELDLLRATLRDTTAVDVPEPSPLFWQHLSERVGEAVRQQPAPRRSQRTPFSWRLLVPASVPVTVVFAGIMMALAARYPPTPGAGFPAPAPVAASLPAEDVAAEDGNWMVFTELTAGIDLETVEETGIAPSSGGVEDALVAALSDEERRELVRLLREETPARHTLFED